MTGAGSIRLDKWLWQARFFKSRSKATQLCAAGRVRVDGAPVRKAATAVRCGSVLTFPHARDIRVVRILDLGMRRGPADEAYGLYEDLSPPPPPPAPTPPGGGRPTKADRRAIDRLLGTDR